MNTMKEKTNQDSYINKILQNIVAILEKEQGK